MLKNLYTLGTLLLKNDRRLHVFFISYNGIDCNVIFHRLKKANGFWTIQLEFVKVANDESLVCYANKASTDLKINDFCAFFNIQLGEGKADVKDIFGRFYMSLNEQVPTKLISLNEDQRQLMCSYIQNHEPADEAAKIYLFDLRKTGNRSEYNNDKAAARYPDIYEHFKDDDEYSFYFTDDYSKEVTLDQLLEKLKRRSDS